MDSRIHNQYNRRRLRKHNHLSQSHQLQLLNQEMSKEKVVEEEAAEAVEETKKVILREEVDTEVAVVVTEAKTMKAKKAKEEATEVAEAAIEAEVAQELRAKKVPKVAKEKEEHTE